MKKTIIPIVILYSFVSCLPVFDFAESMSIKNCTIDTIICGTSIDDSIDSIYVKERGIFRFHNRGGAKWDSTWTVMNNKGMLDICKNELIPPDSMAAYAEPGRLFKRDNKGLFFIIKLETARNHTWDEICRNHLYDTLVVTREMLEQTGNKIEYKR